MFIHCFYEPQNFASKYFQNSLTEFFSIFAIIEATITVKPGQATPQDPINEFIIRRLNPLVVVDFRFVYAFLHDMCNGREFTRDSGLFQTSCYCRAKLARL